jgi:iron complex transport system substrate-binding protein
MLELILGGAKTWSRSRGAWAAEGRRLQRLLPQRLLPPTLLAAAIRCLLLGLLVWGGAASAAPFTLRDDRGTEHRFEASPRRIISLLPSLTESLAVLGGSPRLVGVDRFSNWPAELAALPRLGGLDDTLIEAIATLRPDVVLASTSARSIDRL